LKDYAPELYAYTVVKESLVSITSKQIDIVFDISKTRMIITGQQALTALGISGRLGFEYVHWLQDTSKIVIKGLAPQSKSCSVDPFCLLLTFLSMFPDVNLNSAFKDRRCVIKLNKDDIFVDLYIFLENEIILRIKDYKKDKPIITTKLISVDSYLEVLKNPDKAKEVILTMAHSVLDRDKEEQDQATAVYGDAEEALDINTDSRKNKRLNESEED